MTSLRRFALPALVLAALVSLSGGALGVDPAGAAHPPAGAATLAALNPAPLRLPRGAPARPLGRRAVAIARRQLGVPYAWGGASPSGFDCSGLVTYVYARLGVRLPHNAAAQFGQGRPVPLSRLAPGDLIFFHGLGHVGIVIDRRRYIHSPQGGRSVEIASLASRRGTIDGVRRVYRSV